MKRIMSISAVVILLSGLLLAGSLQQAYGQLILVNLKVKIVAVERSSNRLQVRVHEGGNRDVQYIEIDRNTRFSHRNVQLSHDRAWSSFRKDMLVRVRGGYTVTGHVKAKQIYW